MRNERRASDLKELQVRFEANLSTRAGHVFQIGQYKMQTKYKMQTADCRLQTGYKMQTETKTVFSLNKCHTITFPRSSPTKLTLFLTHFSTVCFLYLDLVAIIS